MQKALAERESLATARGAVASSSTLSNS